MDSKRKDVLTLLLIIVIVIIFGLIGYLGFELINGKVKETNAQEITDEFDDLVPTISEEELEEQEIEENPSEQQQPNDNSPDNQQPSGNSSKPSSGSNGSSSGASKNNNSSSGVSIQGYTVLGSIRIPVTGIKYSIFRENTRQALEKGITLLYTTNGLNQPGNSVVAGHNYRNSSFFSKNKKLKNGDRVIIKDTSGLEITYEVYSIFITNSEDTSFFQRDTQGKREITLSTCTDNGTKTGERLIVCAREI